MVKKKRKKKIITPFRVPRSRGYVPTNPKRAHPRPTVAKLTTVPIVFCFFCGSLPQRCIPLDSVAGSLAVGSRFLPAFLSLDELAFPEAPLRGWCIHTKYLRNAPFYPGCVCMNVGSEVYLCRPFFFFIPRLRISCFSRELITAEPSPCGEVTHLPLHCALQTPVDNDVSKE